MSSLPEPAPLELADLRIATPAMSAPATGPALPLFEVGTSAGVPENLLAPARAAAHAAGYAAGWAHGVRVAEQRARAAADEARIQREELLAEQRAGIARGVGALHTAADVLERRAIPGIEQLESTVLEAAFGIAEALIGHALRDDAVRAPAALSRVLALAPHGEPLTVRLHPVDCALIAGEQLDESSRPITLVADPSLAPGDAIAESGATEIDARIHAGVARVKDALGVR